MGRARDDTMRGHNAEGAKAVQSTARIGTKTQSRPHRHKHCNLNRWYGNHFAVICDTESAAQSFIGQAAL
jgi:hypothetical protein